MNTPKYQALLVEDSKIAQKVAIITLAGLNCTVDTADMGGQAIEMVSKKNYDIILLDLGLPDIDGVAVTEAIRKMEGQARHTPIIALTAHSENEDGVDNKGACLKAGMDDYIEKPIKQEVALELLEKYVHK